ncbi:MAG TPA: hypothetical protein VGV10_07270 [Thermoleophilaceae bacterium]|nr:hypothetical protein [Thermoleophilaceae bacterium]
MAASRLPSRKRGKQSAGGVAAAASVARGLVSQGSTRGSKKGPAALAMAAAGALGGVALVRRRKAGTTPEADATTDTTLHVSSEPVEGAGPPAVGDTGAAPPAS